jgi:hypothetical protein
MLCDMSHITRGNFFRFEVVKLPPQTRRLPAQGLVDANPAYVRGVGLARAAALREPGRGRRPSPATVGQGPREPAGSPPALRLPHRDSLRLPCGAAKVQFSFL